MKNRIFYGSRRLLLVFGVLFLSLALTVVSTQVFQHESYLAMAQSALVRNIPVDGNRGRILDRNGKVLPKTNPAIPSIYTHTIKTAIPSIVQFTARSAFSAAIRTSPIYASSPSPTTAMP